MLSLEGRVRVLDSRPLPWRETVSVDEIVGFWLVACWFLELRAPAMSIEVLLYRSARTTTQCEVVASENSSQISEDSRSFSPSASAPGMGSI